MLLLLRCCYYDATTTMLLLRRRYYDTATIPDLHQLSWDPRKFYPVVPAASCHCHHRCVHHRLYAVAVYAIAMYTITTDIEENMYAKEKEQEKRRGRKDKKATLL